MTFRDTDGRYWLRPFAERADLVRIGSSQRQYDRIMRKRIKAAIAESYAKQLKRLRYAAGQ